MRRVLSLSAVILLLWVGLALAATEVYYSVCPFGTGNLLSGGSPAIEVDSSGNAIVTLNGATLVNNIGQGVAVEYNGAKYFISEITDLTHFKLVDALGVQAPQQVSTSLTSVHHEYVSIASAFGEYQVAPGVVDENHLNGNNLVSLDIALNIACYYDHDDYTTDRAGRIWGDSAHFVTDNNGRHIRIYTPTGGTQSINNQRAMYAWDEHKFIFDGLLAGSSAVYLRNQSVRLEGLQILQRSGGTYETVRIRNLDASHSVVIDSCRINGGGYPITSVYMISTDGSVAIVNTIIENTGATGIHSNSGSPLLTVRNSVVTGCDVGINRTVGTVNVVNSAVFNNTTDFAGEMNITYTASDDNPQGTGNVDISPGATEADDWAEAFADYASGDYTIKSTDSVLYNAGTQQTGYAYDRAGILRPQGGHWDIGAYEWNEGEIPDPPPPPDRIRKLVFIHHSSGGNWLANPSSLGGGLGLALDQVGIYVRDINYSIYNNDFDPPYNSTISDYTDLGHWYTWFADTTLDGNDVPKRDNIMDGEHGVCETTNKTDGHGAYVTSLLDPGGENEIVMFKSCYPSANIYTDNDTVPADLYGYGGDRTVGGQNVNTVSNIKALYNTILEYFKTRPDKMFVVAFNPALLEASTTSERAANARTIANWLVEDWLQDAEWENKNVFVFDLFNELTHANNRHTYDVNLSQVVHYTDPSSGNYSVYPRSEGDNHPSGEGLQKASAHFAPLLKYWIAQYDAWRSPGGAKWNTIIPAKWNGVDWSNLKWNGM